MDPQKQHVVAEGIAGLASEPSPGHIFGNIVSVGCKSEPGDHSVADPSPQTPNCPQCKSQRIWKDGLRFPMFGEPIQRWLCRDCGYRFSDPTDVLRAKKEFEHVETVETKTLKSQDAIVMSCQICVTETKNLDPEQKSIQQVPEKLRDINGKLVQFSWRMQQDGYAPETIRMTKSALSALIARKANLTDPYSVKDVLAKEKKWSQARKRNVITSYTLFLKFLGLTWEKPKCKVNRKIPFIPTEQEIDDIIAGSPNRLATFLQLIKETALRRGEAKNIPWKDVDLERRIILCNCPEKGSNPRIFSNLSGKLLNMINNLARENEFLFGTATENQLKNQLCRTRKRLSFKLANPRLNEIHFHTLRHWKATMLYHDKPDMIIVADFLGHKNLENTRLYIQIEKNLFVNLPNDQLITKVALNTQDACKLIEVGFEYITGEYHDGGKIFRKRK